MPYNNPACYENQANPNRSKRHQIAATSEARFSELAIVDSTRGAYFHGLSSPSLLSRIKEILRHMLHKTDRISCLHNVYRTLYKR